MDKTKLLIAGVLVAIVASAVALVSTKTVVVNQTQPATQNYGAVSGPDMPFQYISVGGVARYHYSLPLATGTTSPCSIQSPAATSTLVSAGIQFTTSSTTATAITIARGTAMTATTTSIGTDYAIAANKTAMIVASTTATAGDATIFPPNTWFNVGMKGGVGTHDAVGVCHAIFESYL